MRIVPPEIISALANGAFLVLKVKSNQIQYHQISNSRPFPVSFKIRRIISFCAHNCIVPIDGNL